MQRHNVSDLDRDVSEVEIHAEVM
jgi:hypothetical protein